MTQMIQLTYTDNKLLFECEAESEFDAFKKAVAAGVNLKGFCSSSDFETGGASMIGLDLSGTDFAYASFSGSDLRWSSFRQADLTECDLRGCDLSGADFDGADLRGALLEGAVLNWSQPELVSEVLFQAAGGDPKKLKVAMLVSAARRGGWCWQNYLELKHPGTRWALSVLAPFVKDESRTPALLWEAVRKVGEGKDPAAV